MAIARRRGDPRWRLLGLAFPNLTPTNVPSLDEWALSQGLEDWPVAEISMLYAEHLGLTPADPHQKRRQARNQRLREQRLALLNDLEATAVEKPHPCDLLHGWLAPELASELVKRGVLTLADLQALIGQGGRWWRGLRAYGPIKAGRLKQQVDLLLGERPTSAFGLTLASSLGISSGASAAGGADLTGGPEPTARRLV